MNFHMDHGLKTILKSIAHNVPNDWDSVILISGSGMVRIGKSVLAQQVGYYLASLLKTPFGIDNILFGGAELIEKAKTFPKYSVFIYDEARGELDTMKVMQEMTKTLLDFFAECGQYNHVVILVLPEFFDLPKSIATNRSEVLLNVYRDRKELKDAEGDDIVEFKRGFFQGFHRKSKKRLYIEGKKNYNDYDVVRRDFYGDFPNIYTVDEGEYRRKKTEYLGRNREDDGDTFKLDVALRVLCNHIPAMTAEKELKEYGFNISDATILRHVNKFPKENHSILTTHD